ncbi:Zinc finger C3HC4 RING-type [Trinorchestia longiramus]|nr:Zinc finger C3HC4 RING-type [Trinorchestia longiramus]
MSDTGHNLEKKSTLENNSLSASATKSTKFVSYPHQDLNLNGAHLNLISPSLNNSPGVDIGTSVSSLQAARLPSPMDVDDVADLGNLIGNSFHLESRKCDSSSHESIAKHNGHPATAVDDLLQDGYCETSKSLQEAKTSRSTSTQTLPTVIATSAIDDHEHACSSHLTNDYKMSFKSVLNGGNSFSATNNNQTTDETGCKPYLDNRYPCNYGTSDLGQIEYNASKYRSNSHLNTSSASALRDDDGQSVGVTGTTKDTILVNYNCNCTASSQPSSGMISCSECAGSLHPLPGTSSSSSASQVVMQSKPLKNGGTSSVLLASGKHEACQQKFRKQPMNNVEKVLSMHTTEHLEKRSSVAMAEEDCSICLSAVNEESPYQSDAVTQRGLVGCVELRKCNHRFHTTCLLQSLSADSDSICCPNCKTIHGTMTGIQPNGGSMDVRVNPYSLPGYHGSKTIVITYSFPRGIQGPEHPTPGRPYYLLGFPRTAYLPDTPKGRKVSPAPKGRKVSPTPKGCKVSATPKGCKVSPTSKGCKVSPTSKGCKVLRLLREAFDRRLVFTVGTSATLNQSDCVTWNGIHHKTETTNYGGHGYPDPNYLDNVTMELAAVGVTEDNCTSTSGFGDETIDDGFTYSMTNHNGAAGASSHYGDAGASHYGGAAGASSHYGGAAGASHYGGAAGASSHYGGAAGASSHYGGAAGASSHYGSATGTSSHYGGAGSSSHYGAAGSSSHYGGAGSSSHYGGAGSSPNNYGQPSSASYAGSSNSFSYPRDTTDVWTGVNSSDDTSANAGKFNPQQAGKSSTSRSCERDSSAQANLPRQIKFRTKPNGASEKLLATCTTEVTGPSIIDVMCSLCLHYLDTKAPSQTHKMTERDIVGTAMLINCGHFFHCCCLLPLMVTAPKSFSCPVCRCFHGTITGTQPKGGRMNHSVEKSSLPGHEDCGTIVITYFIPKGKQGPEHPLPGVPYVLVNFPRKAYLPDSEKGRLVLSLLKKAFARRLIFTVGDSASLGLKNCVTWGQISHKTFRTDRQFGYPDPNYLDIVLQELAALGVKK